jgi:hypothetical protein
MKLNAIVLIIIGVAVIIPRPNAPSVEERDNGVTRSVSELSFVKKNNINFLHVKVKLAICLIN